MIPKTWKIEQPEVVKKMRTCTYKVARRFQKACSTQNEKRVIRRKASQFESVDGDIVYEKIRKTNDRKEVPVYIRVLQCTLMICALTCISPRQNTSV